MAVAAVKLNRRRSHEGGAMTEVLSASATGGRPGGGGAGSTVIV
jgi:hypothetical protein